jgi:hypothetical protein
MPFMRPLLDWHGISRGLNLEEKDMIKFAIAGGVLMIGTLLAAEMATAAPVALQPGVSGVAGTLVEKAKYCRFWNDRCAWKCGGGGYCYRRCLWRHGC